MAGPDLNGSGWDLMAGGCKNRQWIFLDQLSDYKPSLQ
jgi:hypothetical protein